LAPTKTPTLPSSSVRLGKVHALQSPPAAGHGRQGLAYEVTRFDRPSYTFTRIGGQGASKGRPQFRKKTVF
jgi:hypothetical protein